MTKKVVIIITASLLMASFFLTLDAAPKMQRAGKMMKHSRFGLHMVERNLIPAKVLLRIKDDIGLTGEQVTKIEKMQEAQQEASIRKQADIRVKELKFKNYLKEDNINRGKMEKMLRGIADMRTGMLVDKINYMLDVKALLTPEQITKLETLKKDRMKKRMMRRGKRKSDRSDRMKKRSRDRDNRDDRQSRGEN